MLEAIEQVLHKKFLILNEGLDLSIGSHNLSKSTTIQKSMSMWGCILNSNSQHEI